MEKENVMEDDEGEDEGEGEAEVISERELRQRGAERLCGSRGLF